MNIIRLMYLLVPILLLNSCNNAQQSKVDYELDAKKLIKDFNDNVLNAKSNYKGKVLRVKGFIYDINEDSLNQEYIILSGESTRGGIRCYFDDSSDSTLLKVKKYEHVIVKGICQGKKNEIILSECIFDEENLAERIVRDLNNFSAMAYQYYPKPTSIGGGGNSFKGWQLPKEFEYTVNGRYSYEISVDGNAIKIIGFGNEVGLDGKNVIKIVLHLYIVSGVGPAPLGEWKSDINRIN